MTFCKPLPNTKTITGCCDWALYGWVRFGRVSRTRTTPPTGLVRHHRQNSASARALDNKWSPESSWKANASREFAHPVAPTKPFSRGRENYIRKNPHTPRFEYLAPKIHGSWAFFKMYFRHQSGRHLPDLDDTLWFKSRSPGAHFGPTPGPWGAQKSPEKKPTTFLDKS